MTETSSFFRWLATFGYFALPVMAVLAPAASPAYAESMTPRLIVKFADTTLKSFPEPSTRVAKLAARTNPGLSLRYVRTAALGVDVVAFEAPVPVSEVERIARSIARDPSVEYAEPDYFVKPDLVPNDMYIGNQTYLGNWPVSMSAYSAWDTTTGSANTVVAVVDTGYTDHAGLAGRFLPGYDFVDTLFISNDGNLRAPDARDPGDWVTQADVTVGPEALDCTVRNSSWHGTAIAGVIAANSNDRVWTAGIDWSAKVLPVRVLGKCGGYDSDIIDGVAWAGGISVPGVPDNAFPAQVINLSLGDYDRHACPASYQTVINAVLAHGVTRAIVVSAGNNGEDVASHTPANCAGVIAVATVDGNGSRMSYSNFGAVTISAPSGILVLVNTGTQGPAVDGIAMYDGTSFSAAMVSGTASLMLAVAPSLSAGQIRSIIAGFAKPFPAGSTCTTAICGAGILDAGAAVRASVIAVALLNEPHDPATVIEYYNATLDHYFITWAPQEISDLDTGVHEGWTRTGQSFKAYMTAQAETSPVCRFYIPPALGDSHFFGRGTEECDSTGQKNPSFALENPAFMQMLLPTVGVCRAGTINVYRVFSNRADANHRYMIDKGIRDQMTAKGWTVEGDGADAVVMCAPQ